MKSYKFGYFAYLTAMPDTRIVQFVSFETTLERAQFIQQWEKYTRSVDSDVDVTLQQTEKKSSFRYIAQHRCAPGEFQFHFTKAKKSVRTPEVGIRERQFGGYSILQQENIRSAKKDESKVFVFLIDPQVDCSVYKKLSSPVKLNIYQAYFENCQYQYILEFFVKDNLVATLLDDLRRLDALEVEVYKECTLQEMGNISR